MYTSTTITLGGILGVYVALLALVFALFCVDRYHEIFLRATVERAKQLEGTLHMALSETIDTHSVQLKTATWGLGLYILFCGANLFLVVGRVLEFNTLNSLIVSFEKSCLFITTALLFAAVFIALILIYHTKKKYKDT